MSPRPDSNDRPFPEPFSPRETSDAAAGAGDTPFPPPFRMGGSHPPPAEHDAVAAEPEAEETLPWLVTRDEAGVRESTAETFDDGSRTEAETALAPEADGPGAEAAPLPDWLDLEQEDEVEAPAAEAAAPRGDGEVEGTRLVESKGRPDATPPAGTSVLEEGSAGAEVEGFPAAFDVESEPAALVEAERPDATPPAGTSVLAGSEPFAPEEREPEPEIGGLAATASSDDQREAAARQLEEIAGWLRSADLEQELEATDERGLRLFLAGIVLGRGGSTEV